MNAKSKSSVSGNHRRVIKTVSTLTALILCVLGAMPGRAAVKIWNGTITSGNWSFAANWSGGVAPANGDDLVFPNGISYLNTTNDYAAIRLKSIVFTTQAGWQYAVYGNPIVVSNNISSQSLAGYINFLRLPITSGKNQIFSSDNTNAHLYFEGPLYLDATTVTDIGAGDLTFSGGISGTGGIIKTGSGTLSLLADSGYTNTYTGSTDIRNGELYLNSLSVNLNIVGPLIIGDGVGGTDSAEVRLGRRRQLANDVPVTINSDGLLNTGGYDDAFGALSGNGHIDLGSGSSLEVILSSGDSTFDGMITGTGNFYKHGTNTLTLNGTNTFNGLTIVYANPPSELGGPLLVNGIQTNSDVVVSNTCTLGGNGKVGNTTIASGGTLSPGTSIGKLTIRSNLVLAAGSTCLFELNKAANTNDSIAGLTNVTYGGTLVVTNLSGTLANGDSFKLFTATSYSGAFSSLSLPALGPGLGWTNKLLVDGSIAVVMPPPGDRFWTNVVGGGYDLSGNWLDQVVPGPADNANFTSNASYQVAWPADAFAANAYFNAGSGTITQAIGSVSWTLTNSYIVGRDSGATATVAQVSGALNVTNAAGTALLESRRGTLRLDGGTINADQLVATNPAGLFSFNGGTLVSMGGTISNGTAVTPFVVGVNGSTPAVLDVRSNQPFTLHRDLIIGSNTPNCRLYLTNGGFMDGLLGHSLSVLGQNTASSNNLAVVSGVNSAWSGIGVLEIGKAGANNTMLVSNGGRVTNTGVAQVGANASSSNNQVTVSGTNALWKSYSDFYLGGAGSFNLLVVSNGGTVESDGCHLGFSSGSKGNTAYLTDSNALWRVNNDFIVGRSDALNLLVISNGARVADTAGYIGYLSGAGSNNVVVTGAGSLWSNTSSLNVGYQGSFNQLQVGNDGAVDADFLYLGYFDSSSNNTLTVTGGNLIVTNATGTGILNVRSGTLTLNGGLLRTDRLLLTNGAQSVLAFLGGTLQTQRTTNNNGSVFVVGNGSSSATFELLGSGTHHFFNGLQIANKALLKGNGVILGNVTNASGGTLAPGASIGRLAISNDLVLAAASTNIFEISKSSNTNDNIVGLASVTYGGALQVTNLGGTLVGGENYKLFTAGSYSGTFSSIMLPSLDPGLTWSNKLSLDGSIEVVVLLPGDRYWTNTSGGSYDVATNWLDNLVPTVLDNANFTNNAGYQVNWPASATAANAYFNAASGTLTQSIGSATWTLTNSYMVGRDAGAAATVVHLNGTLNVTNASGNAVLEARRGELRLRNGTINTDRLIVTNAAGQFTFRGGTLTTRGGTVSNSSPTAFIVGDAGSTPAVLSVQAGQPLTSYGFLLGSNAANNQLFVTNGGVLLSMMGSFDTNTIGFNDVSTYNRAVVSGAGSIWRSQIGLYIGKNGASNSLLVANGGEVSSDGKAVLGFYVSGSNNAVVVTDPGSLFSNSQALVVGQSGPRSQLIVTNAGRVVSASLYLGLNASSTNNTFTVDGGGVTVGGLADVLRGTIVLNSGSLRADQLWLINGVQSAFAFNGGTLQVREMTNDNGSAFVVGDGVLAATLELLATGSNRFVNGLRIASNGLLKGNGTIIGNVTNASGGTLSPGASIGELTITSNLVFAAGSTNVFEVNKGANMNDAIVGLASVTYGGTLVVTNLSGTLTNGATFKLFSASTYGGTFSGISAASPGANLRWDIYQLPVDGVLRVVATTNPPPSLGHAVQAGGTSLTLSASGGVPYDPLYLLSATNVDLPVTNWSRVATNYFDAAGNASFSQAISSAEEGHYFRLQAE